MLIKFKKDENYIIKIGDLYVIDVDTNDIYNEPSTVKGVCIGKNHPKILTEEQAKGIVNFLENNEVNMIEV